MGQREPKNKQNMNTKTESEKSPQPAPVLAWHREAGIACAAHICADTEVLGGITFAAIIASHDRIERIIEAAQHAETVRLLEAAAQRVIEFGSSIEQEPIAERLAEQIRTHLAKLSQYAKQEGTQ